MRKTLLTLAAVAALAGALVSCERGISRGNKPVQSSNPTSKPYTESVAWEDRTPQQRNNFFSPNEDYSELLEGTGRSVARGIYGDSNSEERN